MDSPLMLGKYPVNVKVYNRFLEAWNADELMDMMCGKNGYQLYIHREAAEWSEPQDVVCHLKLTHLGTKFALKIDPGCNFVSHFLSDANLI